MLNRTPIIRGEVRKLKPASKNTGTKNRTRDTGRDIQAQTNYLKNTGTKNRTRDTGWNRRIRALSPKKMWVLKITPVIRGEIYKRKQTTPKTQVLKIIPLLCGGIYKRKQTTQYAGTKNHTPAMRWDIQT